MLLPIGPVPGRWLATTRSPAKAWIEALVALPPTVHGNYMLVLLGGASPPRRWPAQACDLRLTLDFLDLLIASVESNEPFLVQPIQRASSRRWPDRASCRRWCWPSSTRRASSASC